MAPPAVKPFARIACWLALAYLLALAGEAIAFGSFDDDFAFLFFPLIVLWVASPALAAAICASASASRAGAAAFLALEAALILHTIWSLVSIHRSDNSTAVVAIFFFPLEQWAAMLVAIPAALILGWRARPDFLKD